jgi:Putative beta-lactamase-inhibitor-like, PepSY-like
MQKPCLTGLAALLGLSMLAVAAHADDEEISVEKLPAAVKKAVKKTFPEAKIRGASREVEGGKETYEVELKVDGRSVDVALNAEGKILEIEKEVPVNELPKAVKKRLAEKYPGAKIEKAEEITRGDGGPVHYEVVIKAEVVLTAKGKVVRASEEDEDDDEKPAAKARKKEKKEHEDEEDEDDEDDDDRAVKRKERDKD